MELGGHFEKNPALQGYLGLALVVGAGLATGGLSAQQALQMELGPAQAVYALTPMLVSVGLVTTGVLVWFSEFRGPAMLRIGGWMFVGMIVFGLVISWTINYEALQGNAVSDGLFLTTTSVTIGGFVGLVLGWLDARNNAYEVQLEREQEKLEAQIDRLDEFAHIVSHDLRNPLNVAAIHLRSVKAEYQDESVEEIEASLDRMERIIEDVLTMAREGQAVEETEPVSLKRVARESWKNVDTRGANLVVTDDQVFMADERHLTHIFENLFRNAIEHGMPNPDEDTSDRPTQRVQGEPIEDGGTTESFRVSVGPLAEGFFVEDTGVGFDDEVRESIFEPGVTTSAEGTGFGLRIVEQMVEAHGWEITARTGTDGGARFEITGIEVTTETDGWMEDFG